jgi:hypothetical protein
MFYLGERKQKLIKNVIPKLIIPIKLISIKISIIKALFTNYIKEWHIKFISLIYIIN